MDCINIEVFEAQALEKALHLDKVISEFELDLKNDVDTSKILISAPKINRLGLQLAGFFDVFPENRIQLVGDMEDAYIGILSKPDLENVVRKIMSYKVPCIIFSQGNQPTKEFIEYGNEFGVPILTSNLCTSDFILKLFNFFSVFFAPEATISGVLVDINGVGTLVRGKSGIGKSEAALELIKRGHRFVADDSVIVTNVNGTLFGTSPELIRNLMEVRGIGIVDISKLYGIGSVLETSRIDLVVQMDEFSYEAIYDRLGIDETTVEILGVSIPIMTIPVKQGRNLAVILEAAARNHSLRNKGHNAAKLLNAMMKDRRENAN